MKLFLPTFCLLFAIALCDEKAAVAEKQPKSDDIQLSVKQKKGDPVFTELDPTCIDCSRVCNTLPASVSTAVSVQLIIPGGIPVFVGYFKNNNCNGETPAKEFRYKSEKSAHRVDITKLLKKENYGSLIWGDLSEEA
ncbi:hypothetical protein HDU92_007006 [Lobulomyces angularis]|nr:hypothetical protein HDU92_007006 [Lobulomyces angularis]